MGANPMQKMKKNSLLIGLAIGLTIGLVLCVIMYFVLPKITSMTKGSNGVVTGAVLNKEIKAGTQITENDITLLSVAKEMAPTDVTTKVVGGVAKIDLLSGTVLGTSMLGVSSETITDDLREQEYNMISLPTTLEAGDFIDIRLQLPNGGDYIVISKKRVLKCNSSTIWLNMYEEEIELMSNAIIEYYIMAGSKLYATKYTDAGLQTASVGTYVPNSDVAALIKADTNVKNYINQERYSDSLKSIRNNIINSYVNQYSDDALKNIEENIQKEIKNLQATREAWFASANSAKTTTNTTTNTTTAK